MPEKEAYKEVGAELTEYIHIEFKDMFSDIGCFKGVFFITGKRKKQTLSGALDSCDKCTTGTIERGNRMPNKTYHYTDVHPDMSRVE